MNIFWFCVVGYVVGSIPFGFIYSKICKGVDIRSSGSHSTGTTNVLRACGSKRLAFITLLSDALKGFLLVSSVSFIKDIDTAMLTGLCCVIGHVYPVWLGFKGGKGVGPTAGILLFIDHITAIISVVIWAVTAKFVKISSIASLSFCSSFVIITFFRFLYSDVSLKKLLFSIILFAFIIYTHRGNIKRMAKNEEEHL